jgi:hypothetical protein
MDVNLSFVLALLVLAFLAGVGFGIWLGARH